MPAKQSHPPGALPGGVSSPGEGASQSLSGSGDQRGGEGEKRPPAVTKYHIHMPIPTKGIWVLIGEIMYLRRRASGATEDKHAPGLGLQGQVLTVSGSDVLLSFFRRGGGGGG